MQLYLLYFHLLYRDMRYEFVFACNIWTLREKETSFCNVLLINHYASSILVKIMHLSQLFFHMLTLQTLT